MHRGEQVRQPVGTRPRWANDEQNAKQVMQIVLNRYQLQALAVVLRGFEQSLRETDRWLRGEVFTTGLIYDARLQLSEERRIEALSQVAEALHIVARVGEQLDLGSEEVDLGRRIAAVMSIHWANLWDVRSAKLRRYGPTDPALAAMLDPEVEHLARLASEIGALMSEPRVREDQDDGDAQDRDRDGRGATGA